MYERVGKIMKKMLVRTLACVLAVACLLSLAACGKAASIQDYISSDFMQKALETQKAELGDTADVDLTAEGDKLIYTFTYKEAIDADMLESVSAALESALAAEEMVSTFEGVASELKKAVDVENPVVVVKYVTTDGTELFSKEFTAAE